jgi:hypothetical protein
MIKIITNIVIIIIQTSACIPYWPQNDGSSLEIGDFTITKKFSSSSTSYSTSTLTLTHVPTRFVILLLLLIIIITIVFVSDVLAQFGIFSTAPGMITDVRTMSTPSFSFLKNSRPSGGIQ